LRGAEDGEAGPGLQGLISGDAEGGAETSECSVRGEENLGLIRGMEK
jgi:hypothetical protein